MKNILAALLIALLLTAGCDQTESDWKAAKQANTGEAYNSFLAKHAQGPRANEAKSAIDNLAWNDAKARSTIDAFSTYMSQYTQGQHLVEAKTAIEELAWAAAKTQNTPAAYKTHLAQYPQDRHFADASAALEDIEWHIAETTNTVVAYEHFINQHMTSSRLQKAREAIEKLDYDAAIAANTVADYEAFIRKHEHAAAIEEVRQLLSQAKERTDWKAAEKSATADGFRRFLATYPDTPYVAAITGTFNVQMYTSELTDSKGNPACVAATACGLLELPSRSDLTFLLLPKEATAPASKQWSQNQKLAKLNAAQAAKWGVCEIKEMSGMTVVCPHEVVRCEIVAFRRMATDLTEWTVADIKVNMSGGK